MQRNSGICVIFGFHSRIEKDVFHFLEKGDQSIILVHARGISQSLKSEFENQIKTGRLLIISPFDESVTRVTSETADKRNRAAAGMADEIFIAYADRGGKLEKLACELLDKNKAVSTFDVEANRNLIDMGARGV